MKKRFIAGAVCPKCAEMDRLVMYRNEADEEVRECISCGFVQTSTEQKQEDSLAVELTTRVTPTGKSVLDEGEQPLKIIGFSDD